MFFLFSPVPHVFFDRSDKIYQERQVFCYLLSLFFLFLLSFLDRSDKTYQSYKFSVIFYLCFSCFLLFLLSFFDRNDKIYQERQVFCYLLSLFFLFSPVSPVFFLTGVTRFIKSHMFLFFLFSLVSPVFF